MGFGGRTPVVNVSFVHMLTTQPQLCTAPSSFGRSVLFADPAYDLIPTLEEPVGTGESWTVWKTLDHSACHLGTGLFGPLDIRRW